MPINAQVSSKTQSVYTVAEIDAKLAALSSSSVATDSVRFIVFSNGWAARPNDNRRTMFLGGAAATNQPPSTNLRSFDIWIPTT